MLLAPNKVVRPRLPPVQWQWQALQSDCVKAIGSTMIPLIQLLRLELIYIHAHPLINWKNVSFGVTCHSLSCEGQAIPQGKADDCRVCGVISLGGSAWPNKHTENVCASGGNHYHRPWGTLLYTCYKSERGFRYKIDKILHRGAVPLNIRVIKKKHIFFVTSFS